MKPDIVDIVYTADEPLGAGEFIAVLEASTLAERRPVDDAQCIAAMVENADLTVTARYDGKLVGVARSVTDFSYCCYLSDLAVAREYQRRGIGTELIRRTKQQLGPTCTLILLSAPAAVEYYPRLGFERHPQAWLLDADRDIR